MEKLKVLYAEDDPLTVMEVAEQLEERGFEVIVATNGTEALKLFRERQPNVVLLDVDMPGHNGFEVLQIIRLTDHYTPIVIYSSLGDEANQMRGLESGAYTYLVKNCAPAVVAAQVYNCLSSHPLKSPFLRDIVLIQYLADFIKHAPKSFHGSFEVIGRCRQKHVHSIPNHTLIKVAVQSAI